MLFFFVHVLFVIDVVCRDAVSGHEIRMMLALSLLDELICLEGRGAWLYYLSKQGKTIF